jgi:hypothetical protein
MKRESSNATTVERQAIPPEIANKPKKVRELIVTRTSNATIATKLVTWQEAAQVHK